jgi:hypothetical protein
MLHIFYLNDKWNNQYHQYFEFDCDKELEPRFSLENIILIKASERELEYIYRTFIGVPHLTIRRHEDRCKEEVTWFGDHAKFIIANWGRK